MKSYIFNRYLTIEKKHVEKEEPILSWDIFEYLYQYSKRIQLLWERQEKINNRVTFPTKPEFKDIFGRRNYDSLDYMLILESKPKNLRIAIKAFNDHFEILSLRKQPDIELMKNLKMLIESMQQCVADMKERRENSINNKKNPHKTKEEYILLFFRLCPELEVFIDLYQQEIDAQSNLSKILLDWESLRLIRRNLENVKEQINYKKYYLHTWTSTEEDMAAECSTEIIKQIDLYEHWFSKEQIRMHGYLETNIACRRANQDLGYLLRMIEINQALPRLQNDILELRSLFDFYHEKCISTSKATSLQVKTSYLEYLETLEYVKTLRQQVMDQNKSKIIMKDRIYNAVTSELDRELACKNAITIIKSTLKYMDQKQLTDKEVTTFSHLLKVIEELKPIEKKQEPFLIEESKEDLTKASTEVEAEFRPIDSLLHWNEIQYINKKSKELLITLKEKSYTTLGSITIKERERLTLIEYLKSFDSHFSNESKDHRNSEKLKNANEALSDLLSRIKVSFELQKDIALKPFLQSLFDSCKGELNNTIYWHRKNLNYIQCCNNEMQNEILQLKTRIQSPESLLEFYIKQACKEHLKKPKPYEAILNQIFILIYLMIVKEKSQTFSMEGIGKFNSIFVTINQALTPPMASDPPAEFSGNYYNRGLK